MRRAYTRPESTEKLSPITQIELKLALPDTLAHEAEEAGLLTAQAIERLLREEVRRRHVDRFFESADRLAAVPGTALSAEEVEAEIQAARAARRSADARHDNALLFLQDVIRPAVKACCSV